MPLLRYIQRSCCLFHFFLYLFLFLQCICMEKEKGNSRGNLINSSDIRCTCWLCSLIDCLLNFVERSCISLGCPASPLLHSIFSVSGHFVVSSFDSTTVFCSYRIQIWALQQGVMRSIRCCWTCLSRKACQEMIDWPFWTLRWPADLIRIVFFQSIELQDPQAAVTIQHQNAFEHWHAFGL